MGLPLRLMAGLGVSTSVGGSVLWYSPSATLIMPANPAVLLVWPIIDLTDPTAQVGRSSPVFWNSVASASASTWSPSRVPVPCASISPSGRGVETGLAVGPPQRQQLAQRPRRGQAAVAAVAGCANPLHHGVDAVAVALGILQPLQDHHRQPFADGDAVGFHVEGAAASPR